MRDEGWVLRKHSRLGEARIMHANSEKSVQSNPRGLVAENIAQAVSLKLNYTCHGLGLGDRRRPLGGRREGGQIIRVTYILLDELSVNYAGSGDQLLGIEVNEVVAGLCQKRRWAEAGLPGHRQQPAASRGRGRCSRQSLGATQSLLN